jgi:hypothetical protein
MSTADLSARCVVVFTIKVLPNKTVAVSALDAQVQALQHRSPTELREQYKDGVVTEGGRVEVRVYDEAVAARPDPLDGDVSKLDLTNACRVAEEALGKKGYVVIARP